MKGNKKRRVWPILTVVAVALIAVAAVYCHFGGFGTGPCADTKAMRTCATEIADITIPSGTKVIGLGEATHGNREFQQLRLDVFRHLVEDYGIRGFALEGDFGGCEVVNRYIHGKEGSVREAAAAIGFAIYRTEETEQLIEWMRAWNETAEEGEDLCFYGYDSQRIAWSRAYLLEAASSRNIDTTELEQLCATADPNQTFGEESDRDIINDIREQLIRLKPEESGDPSLEKAIHYADSLLQNIELGTLFRNNDVSANAVRDSQMKDNVLWILRQEEQRGNEAVLICGHNGHIRKSGQYGPDQDCMGALLAADIGEDSYFAIGTDFFKATDNLPLQDGRRVSHTLYSYDPLAKAADRCGYDICWLDFAAIPEDSSLREQTDGYINMGMIGEVEADGLSGVILRLIPASYRIKYAPGEMYNGMIFVSDAHPIEIQE
jgi:erythromycin esterase